MRQTSQHQIRLCRRRVDYRVVHSTTAVKLRLRIGPNGVEVIQPAGRSEGDVAEFLTRNAAWVVEQLQRTERLRGLRRLSSRAGEILFRGEPTEVRIEPVRSRASSSAIGFASGEIVIRRGPEVRTAAASSLEYWLRREARRQISHHLGDITARLGREPGRVYVMGQRTKWGNCSARGNLSFNWRLILAPDSVLRYIVTHEAVHLAVPDHSKRFWLTVQSLCPETERAKQWLSRHHAQLTVNLEAVLSGWSPAGMSEHDLLKGRSRA